MYDELRTAKDNFTATVYSNLMKLDTANYGVL